MTKHKSGGGGKSASRPDARKPAPGAPKGHGSSGPEGRKPDKRGGSGAGRQEGGSGAGREK